jgi:hypothetical protein
LLNPIDNEQDTKELAHMYVLIAHLLRELAPAGVDAMDSW